MNYDYREHDINYPSSGDESSDDNEWSNADVWRDGNSDDDGDSMVDPPHGVEDAFADDEWKMRLQMMKPSAKPETPA